MEAVLLRHYIEALCEEFQALPRRRAARESDRRPANRKERSRTAPPARSEVA